MVGETRGFRKKKGNIQKTSRFPKDERRVTHFDKGAETWIVPQTATPAVPRLITKRLKNKVVNEDPFRSDHYFKTGNIFSTDILQKKADPLLKN